MKLIIEIPEEDYDHVKSLCESNYMRSVPMKAIANGTPITDDMISREALKNEYAEKCAGECDCCLYNDHFDGCNLINNAPTIGGARCS